MNEDQLKSYIKAVFKNGKYNVKMRKAISVGALSPSFLSGSDLSERSTRWLPISHEKVQLIAKCNLLEDSNLIKWMIEKGIRHKNTQIIISSNEFLLKRVFVILKVTYKICNGSCKQRKVFLGSLRPVYVDLYDESSSVIFL